MNNVVALTANKRKQGGFTLVEIMIAVVVVTILVYLGVQKLGGRSDTAKAASARTFFVQDLPAALASFGGQTGQNTQITDKNSLVPYGVSQETAWGDSWTANNGTPADGVKITYPIGSKRPDKIGQDLVNLMESKNKDGDLRFPFITNPSYSDGSLTATVRAY